ncbi:hypothetical protein FRC07_000815 [Ceratobasidium sp. 392]|nr:hypothetical protein FRC07_000815 [Ceratobasidium sp. 392]
MTTTRLHISGLTPSITQNDLKKRFSTFGEVKDVDGVGKLDGLGQPRKFAYVTLEGTREKLARCMNLLSGSTWKGAKLRIGEAKLDYRARHELETNSPARAPRPKLDAEALKRARLKRRLRARRLMRGVQGREAKDMGLVTLENADKRKGWRRTPLGHLIRPLRMRPLHPIPLPPKRHQLKSKLKSKLKPKAKPGNEKRVFKLTRARCTVIDPARYGAVHVSAGKGGLGDELLFGGVVGMGAEEKVEDKQGQEDVEMVDDISSTISSGEEPEVEVEPVEILPSPLLSPVLSARDPTSPTSKLAVPPVSRSIIPDFSLAKEKADTLALLGGLFSGDEWGGRESVSGEEGEVEVEVRGGDGAGGDVGYEVVPREGDVGRTETNEEVEGGGSVDDEDEGQGEDKEEQEEADGEDMEVMDEHDDNASAEDVAQGAESEDQPLTLEVQHNVLKDMFKPQEESAGFSLGLDIELDPDAESFLPASNQLQPEPEPQVITTTPVSTQTHTIQYTPDPRALMFFPTSNGKRDVFSLIEEKGWRWEHPGTLDEIKAKWEKNKAELTREYTRRHREAVKRRRRGGVVRGEEV